MESAYIKSLNVGKPQLLGSSRQFSAIHKSPILTAQQVGLTGLLTDQQADKKFHGGTEQALHQYALEHYDYWQELLPENHLFNTPGAFGENISSLGMTEETVMIGDCYRLGNTILEVSTVRQPCWKLNVRFDYLNMAKAVQTQQKTGWYYRVIEEGFIQQGDTFELLDRPYPDYSLTRLLQLLYGDPLNQAELHQALQLKTLPANLKNLFQKRLDTSVI